MPKIKTHKATAKRFKYTGGGKLMRTKIGKSHLRRQKKQRVKRQFDEMHEVTSSAAKKRASIWKMAHQSGHKSLDVLRRYVENEEVFDDHAGADLLK